MSLSSGKAWQDSIRHYLPEKDAMALEFQLDGPLKLGGHIGNGITLKKFNEPDRATRLGLYLNMYREAGDGESIRERLSNPQDGLQVNELEKKILLSQYTLYTTLQFIRYKMPTSKFALSYGWGPIAGFTSSTSEFESGTVYGYSSDYEDRSKNNSKYLWMGLSGMVGTEWFVHPAFSIHAENHASFQYGKSVRNETYFREYDSGEWNKDEDKITGPRIEFTNRILLGVSFYFD